MKKQRILITGAAGFIGSHVSAELLSLGHDLLCVDSMNDYYSPNLKRNRFEELVSGRAPLLEGDLCNDEFMDELFRDNVPTFVIHLAAQPGVRLPIKEYGHYIKANISGQVQIFRKCIEFDNIPIIYASSSSVYGDSDAESLSEFQTTLLPTSFYGMTKKFDEEFAHLTAKRYGLRTRGVRFFSVYGPWGRPDMAYFRAIASTFTGESFTQNGNGKVKRDFTFITDIVRDICFLMEDLRSRDDGFSDIVNIGGGNPVSLIDLLSIVSEVTGTKVKISMAESVMEDVKITKANTNYLESLTGSRNFVDLRTGIEVTYEWMKKQPRELIKMWVDSV
jgi:UDP-glucuronate 4-epimerase